MFIVAVIDDRSNLNLDKIIRLLLAKSMEMIDELENSHVWEALDKTASLNEKCIARVRRPVSFSSACVQPHSAWKTFLHTCWIPQLNADSVSEYLLDDFYVALFATIFYFSFVLSWLLENVCRYSLRMSVYFRRNVNQNINDVVSWSKVNEWYHFIRNNWMLSMLHACGVKVWYSNKCVIEAGYLYIYVFIMLLSNM